MTTDRDPEDEWEEVPAPRRRSEKRRLDSMVSVRFTPAEVDELRRMARGLGMSLSGYLRWMAFRHDRTFTNTAGATTVTIAGPVVVRYPESEAS